MSTDSDDKLLDNWGTQEGLRERMDLYSFKAQFQQRPPPPPPQSFWRGVRPGEAVNDKHARMRRVGELIQGGNVAFPAVPLDPAALLSTVPLRDNSHRPARLTSSLVSYTRLHEPVVILDDPLDDPFRPQTSRRAVLLHHRRVRRIIMRREARAHRRRVRRIRRIMRYCRCSWKEARRRLDYGLPLPMSRQLEDYPDRRHDDMVDAFAHAVSFLRLRCPA